MTTNDRLDRVMSSWLHEDADFRVPDHLDEVLQAEDEKLLARIEEEADELGRLRRWVARLKPRRSRA